MLREFEVTKRVSNSEAKRELQPRVVVIGVGNLLLKDEGIGIHTIKALQKAILPQDVKIIDGGTVSDLITYSEARDKLILIDAAKAGGEPGTIYRFGPEALASEAGKAISSHELDVEQSLKLMKMMKNEPRKIIIIGVEPKEIDWGTELSPTLQQKLPQIVSIVLQEISSDRKT